MHSAKYTVKHACSKNTRVQAAFWVVNPRKDPIRELENAQRIRQKYAGIPNLTIPGIKVFADGVLEYPSQTASLTGPYKNTGRPDDLLFEPARFAQLVIAADKQGLIVHVHALGDRAVKESLNGIEAARKANGDSGLPHTPVQDHHRSVGISGYCKNTRLAGRSNA
jgi:predicted amidohydrolase YtcJ